ncbi:uncharacterized protein [Watersipora subatra]|uniref:uncharacterized protein n=1 Tax=Watersipora subatra TaxID=2589382 RepID=UPI00355B86DD
MEGFIGQSMLLCHLTASLSSRRYPSYNGPWSAVDGSKRKVDANLAMSDIQDSPWIQLDLSIAHCIHIIKFYKQVMGWQSDGLMDDVKITIGETVSDLADESEKHLCAYYDGKPPGEEFTMTCTQRLYGRLIRVTTVGDAKRMSVREIEVFGW